jgi:hypothetical protein
MKMSTAQKILKFSKRERDRYIEVIERMYVRYKQGFGTSVLVYGSDTEGFEFHEIGFLKPEKSIEVINFLEAEKILQKRTTRIGEEYETAEEVPTLLLLLNAFNALVSGLKLDTVPKHIQDLPELVYDVEKRALTCGKESVQFRDRNSFARVILLGIFDSYPTPFTLTDDILLHYGLNETSQTLSGICSSLNKSLKGLMKINENPLTYANYVFTLRAGLKLSKIGQDPRDYS